MNPLYFVVKNLSYSQVKYKARAGLETENSSKKSRTEKGAALAFF